jgi:hypothetical protein
VRKAIWQHEAAQARAAEILEDEHKGGTHVTEKHLLCPLC